MRKEKKEDKRVLARVLAEELRKVRGSGDPVYPTVTESGRKDITDANSGDRPPV